jgi:membrane protease subunit HflK
MAWNDGGNGQDPWKREGNEPNDLDKIVQNWQRKLSSIFGGGRQTSAAGSSGGYVLAVILIIAWAATGMYRIDQAERGVEQRFGAYTITTLPGSM